ncbi:MAG: bifunctional indole-3-glycerol-phosphate synthase TrpC/phosphoribosylanthranilate isomerase TrpF [Corynebacterium sp.]|nr:bifunctional indole-3-glycerol-phosphate synthase TrpC/phosphoribosylanthranilate isomerase TrpF [Corynebacterium sp.]
MSLPTVLENIVAQRRTHVPEITDRIAHVDRTSLPTSTRSLYRSLRAGGRGSAHFIMECKAASPSLGLIRDNYHPAEIARIYSKYAAGISVLCEPERFNGDYNHLATVAATTHLPVLCKDFIIDPVQIYAARYFGADAILLMLSVLDDSTYTELAAIADSLGLDILTEVIDAEEIARALRLGAKIIGINNRNLHDLTIDLNRTKELSVLAPDDVVVISESGIRNNKSVRDLAGYCNGFLVGSQLTGTPDIDFAIRQLLYGNVKVCGLRTPEAAQVAAAQGASFGGLITVTESPRYVSRETAKEIMDAAPQLRYVSVTRETTDLSNAFLPGIHALQLHAPFQGSAAGELEYITYARAHITKYYPGQVVQTWRAVSMTNPEAVAALPEIVAHVDHLVLDSQQGGSGEVFPWERIPTEVKAKAFLAGGVGPSNITAALAQNCAGIDLNSGVEYPKTAGAWAQHKDAGALGRTCAAIRNYHRALE